MKGSDLRFLEERDCRREQHALLKLAPRPAAKAEKYAKQAIEKVRQSAGKEA